jgi:hypothetical protein
MIDVCTEFVCLLLDSSRVKFILQTNRKGLTKKYFEVYSRKFAYEESDAYYLFLHEWKK